jgi:hypothetical protein
MQKIQNAKSMPKRDLDDEFPCLKMQLPELWKMKDLERFLNCIVKQYMRKKKLESGKLKDIRVSGLSRGPYGKVSTKISKNFQFHADS